MKPAVQIEVLRELMTQLDEGVNADAGGVMSCPASTYTAPISPGANGRPSSGAIRRSSA
jgi:hypothetical protein